MTKQININPNQNESQSLLTNDKAIKAEPITRAICFELLKTALLNTSKKNKIQIFKLLIHIPIRIIGEPYHIFSYFIDEG